MIESLWGNDYLQNQRISAARSTANKGASDAKRAKVGLRACERRVDKLTMICMAMWSLLQEQSDLTEADLLQRIEDIDLKDGKLDGKAAPAPATCPACGRTFHPKRVSCLYCGAEHSSEGAFDQVL